MTAQPPWGPTGPPPGYQPPPQPEPVHQPPRRKRHIARWFFGGLGALVVLIIVASVAAGGGSKGNSPGVTVPPVTTVPSAGTSSAPAPPSASATPPVALTGKQAKFVRLLKASFAKRGDETSASDAQLLTSGKAVCKLLAIESPGKIKSQTGGRAATTGLIIKAAEHSLCTKYLPKVLMHLAGNGIGASAPFTVNTSSVKVQYTFDCSSQFGGDGNFIGDLQSGNPSSLSSDDQNFANVIAARGSKTTFVYPENQGDDYHVEINSECDWTVTVKS